jgi:hypothetical protein
MTRVVSFLSVLAVLAVMFVLSSCSSSPLSSSPPSSDSIYVSTSGNDANDGLSPSKPVRTLVKAMEIANTKDKAANVVIKVGSGVYTPDSGLSSSGSGFVINRPNIVISGGWNSDFSSVEGKSELDGNGSLRHVVMIKDVTNVKLENLVIRGGIATNTFDGSDPDSSGGGIYVSKVSYLVIESSVVISNNGAYFGGGLFLSNSTYTTISGNVYDNAAIFGGGVILVDSPNTTISGSVYSNFAYFSGGGLYLYNSPNTTISGSVYGNSANNRGGGLFLEDSPNTTISGSVYGNSATNGGGLYLEDSPNTTISGSVYGNRAIQYGGGVYLDYSDYFTNTGWITNNTAGSAGGGVYRIGSYDNSDFGNVSDNYPNDIAP